MTKKLLQENSGKLFQSFFRGNSKTNKNNSYLSKNTIENLTLNTNNFKNTNSENYNSFRYDNKIGLVSTQEINIDYSEFSNHTFFHSAVAKTNEAFFKIINNYPFYGSIKTIESFEDSLTGYEKYILDLFPKNVDYLIFSGSNDLLSGNYLSIKDSPGTEIASLASSNKHNNKTLDPLESSFTIQFYLKIPEEVNDNQIIVQKYESIANNFTLFLSESTDTTSCDLCFGIQSSSFSLYATSSIKKGNFVHVNAIYDNIDQEKIKLITFNSDTDYKIVSSSNSIKFDNLFYNRNNLKIGTGEECRINNDSLLFVPKQTLSGSIDEFRYYKTPFSLEDIKKNKNRSNYLFDDELILYYKFNEPYGDFIGNNFVLDSSLNSFNTTVKNYNYQINKNQVTNDTPVAAEDVYRSPVLFPDYQQLKDLNSSLITSASLYDKFNPNIITRLVPPHYLREGNASQNIIDAEKDLEEDFNKLSYDINHSQKSISAQLILKLLFTWAKFFDEMKIFIDNFTAINSVALTYEDKNTISDKFLQKAAKKIGIRLPLLFSSANLDQLFLGYNSDSDPKKLLLSLFEVQNKIWRRMLSDLPFLANKKGNIDTIKNIFRLSGIEPDNIMNFREYGGTKRLSLEASKKFKKDIIFLLNFSGSKDHQNENVNALGYSDTSPYIKSSFLSGSRVQIGTPAIQGTFVNKTKDNPHGISNAPSDGLLTSGSFTYAATYRLPAHTGSYISQSLARFHITGTNSSTSLEACYLNLIATNEKLILKFKDSPEKNSKIKDVFIDNVNIFDNNLWSISFGKQKKLNEKSDLFFLRLGKSEFGNESLLYSTSSFFVSGSDSVFENISAYNTSGSFITVGSQSLNPSNDIFLNTSSVGNVTYFDGQIGYINFWSKYTTDNDFITYMQNPNSLSIDNPLKNYNFTNDKTGSFERLIINTSGQQKTSGSNANGEITLFDFSQNEKHFQGNSFEPNKYLMKPNYKINKILSPDFDVNATDNKVRIRSVQNAELLKFHPYAIIAPVFEVQPNEEVTDDTRFSIDMSVMNGLNTKIMEIFSDFSFFENALGKPNLMYSNSYIDLKEMRKIYFNNILEKINLEKYREVFKWIDNTFTDIVYNMVPKSTNFLGINFVYESNVLERHKLQYLNDEIYLKAENIDNMERSLLLSQFACILKMR